jgi:hypothetical protein
MVLLGRLQKRIAAPANQWTLGMPSADVHIEKWPAQVHPSRPKLSAPEPARCSASEDGCSLWQKSILLSCRKMKNKTNFPRPRRTHILSYDNKLQQKTNNGHLVKTNPILSASGGISRRQFGGLVIPAEAGIQTTRLVSGVLCLESYEPFTI